MSDPRARKGVAVVCFAVPDESRLFRAALTKRRISRGGPHPLPTTLGEWAGISFAVVHTGVGATPAGREHVARLLAETPVLFVVSAGYAGALLPELDVGDLILSTNHSAPVLFARARPTLDDEPFYCGDLHTASSAIETAEAKAALRERTGALAVDMETSWIAEICAGAQLPLLSLRVISDAADQDFPVPSHVLYDAARQRPRYLALPAWLALHPGRIGPFVRFVRGLGPARERLTRALQKVVPAL